VTLAAHDNHHVQVTYCKETGKRRRGGWSLNHPLPLKLSNSMVSHIKQMDVEEEQLASE